MSIGVDRIKETAIGALHAAAVYHAEVERLRYEAWRKLPAKDKPKWEGPVMDRQAMIDTFTDFFGAAMDAIREEALRDAKQGGAL